MATATLDLLPVRQFFNLQVSDPEASEAEGLAWKQDERLLSTDQFNELVWVFDWARVELIDALASLDLAVTTPEQTQAQLNRAPAVLTTEMLPARNGTSLVIDYGTADSPRRVLVDCGPKGSNVASRLRQDLGPTLELLVLSHIDNNAIGDAVDLLQNRDLEIRDVWFNGYRHLSSEGDHL